MGAIEDLKIAVAPKLLLNSTRQECDRQLPCALRMIIISIDKPAL